MVDLNNTFPNINNNLVIHELFLYNSTCLMNPKKNHSHPQSMILSTIHLWNSWQSFAHLISVDYDITLLLLCWTSSSVICKYIIHASEVHGFYVAVHHECVRSWMSAIYAVAVHRHTWCLDRYISQKRWWMRTEIDLNECEHFLKANWDRSKRVWTLSQSEPASIWDRSKSKEILMWTLECELSSI